jgi:hypothetical protein
MQAPMIAEIPVPFSIGVLLPMFLAYAPVDGINLAWPGSADHDT